MNKNLFCTILVCITITSTLTSWEGYDPKRPWGWAGPSDEQIAEIRAHQAKKQAATESVSILTAIEQFIIKNAVISQDEPELEDDNQTDEPCTVEAFLKSFINDTDAAKINPTHNQETQSASKRARKQKDDADYCTIS